SRPASSSRSAAVRLRRREEYPRPSIVNSTGSLMSMTLSEWPIAILSRCVPPPAGGSPVLSPARGPTKVTARNISQHFRWRSGAEQPDEMMKELAVTVGTHPLVADRARLDKITDNMYAQIHRALHGVGRDGRAERILHGGQSADDVLQEALIALLEYD